MNVPFGDPLDCMQEDAHGPRLGVIFAGKAPTGDDLKEEGMAKSLVKKANRHYRDVLVETLKLFAVGSIITSEKLTGIVGRPESFGATNSCVGSSFNFMASKGLIERTGRMVKPLRKERHSNLIPEWEVRKYL